MDNLQALLSALTQDTLPLTLIKEAAGVFLAVLMAWVLAWMLGRRVSYPSVLFGEKSVHSLNVLVDTDVKNAPIVTNYLFIPFFAFVIDITIGD